MRPSANRSIHLGHVLDFGSVAVHEAFVAQLVQEADIGRCCFRINLFDSDCFVLGFVLVC